MPPDTHAEARRLFDDLIDLAPGDRERRLAALALDSALADEVSSLIAAADEAGDFLGLLGPAALSAGDTVMARYRIVRHLGSGTMGDVYLAWDEQLERPVALKFLRDARDEASDASVARFRAEARAAARLDHPHVATVFDNGETADRRRFIVMAYYAGESLKQRIERGALPATEALRIASQLASALAEAHAAGIVHRDVKPANVLFDAAGAARLTDFGIAKLLSEPAPHDTGLTLGTPAYMSPEQRRGEPADAGADLWALGVMLHEMLTGRRPGQGNDAPPVGEAPGAAHALVAALLADDRALRPARAEDVRQALDDILANVRAPSPRGSLPGTVTSLIGREHELSATTSLLAQTRLLTLTGPGGTGKTRLALALAAQVRDGYADGAWFVSLAEIGNAALVPSAIAHALGARDLGTLPSPELAVSAIGARKLLLLLDNFEHVLGAASFVAMVLAKCANARVLVTSREPLHVQGEQVFPVPPLRTAHGPGEQTADTEAIRLFVSRARAVRPSFTLDDESLPVVAEICRRLDGLPLALELAAARAKLLSPRAILSRLEQRSDLLRAEGDDRPARHGTMRTVMEWSYVLLTDEERALFCRLAVFTGGVSLEGAEAVATELAAHAPTASRALDVIASLSSKSLIQSEEQPDGEPRLVMLETVREFGLDRLVASDGVTEARRAHRRYCLTLAERGAERMRGPGQAEWLHRLERDYANFRLALDVALEDPGDGVRDAARLAVALHRLWLARGPLHEGISYIHRILAAAELPGAPPLDGLLLARLLSSAAHLAGARSLFRDAAGLFTRALVLYRAAGDQAGVAATLNNLAWQVWALGDLATGAAMSMEAMEVHQQLGDELGMALSRNNLAWIAMERGELDVSEAHFQAVIESHRRRGDARSAAFSMSWLGTLAARRGDVARAVALHEQSLNQGQPVADVGYHTMVLARIAAARHALGMPGQAAVLEKHIPGMRDLGRLWPLGTALTELARMLLDAGETARAREVLTEAAGAWDATGGRGGRIEATMLSGVAERQAGDLHRAAALLGEALVAARDYGGALLMAACIEEIATLALDARRADTAARLFAAATRARNERGAHRSPRRAAELRLRMAALGDAPNVETAMVLSEAALVAIDLAGVIASA